MKKTPSGRAEIVRAAARAFMTNGYAASSIDAVAKEFDLHPLAVEDTVNAHQRPKLEQYGDTTFVVLRPARYVDPVEVINIGEVHLFLGPEFAITVRHADEPDLGQVRKRLEAAGDIEGAVRDCALRIAANAPLTVRATKEMIRRIMAGRRLRPGEDRDVVTMCYSSHDFREGVEAFVAKRAPKWTGT